LQSENAILFLTILSGPVISSRKAADAMRRKSRYASFSGISGLESWGVSAALELNLFVWCSLFKQLLYAFFDILKDFIKSSVY
jgi:hypothetical protein